MLRIALESSSKERVCALKYLHGRAMELEIPELRELPAALEPVVRRTRRTADQATVVEGALSVGEPIVQAVTAELAGDDTPLREFIAQTQEWRFFVVYLGCSFLPPDGGEFDKVWVSVQLERADLQDPGPIVWSLAPVSAKRAVERSRTIKLGANVQLGQAFVELGSRGEATEIFIESLGLQQSSCTWIFNKTSTEQIRGAHRLILVARCPSGKFSHGVVEVRAMLRQRRWALSRYRVSLPEGSPLEFSLPA
jgi:hypothetical protein